MSGDNEIEYSNVGYFDRQTIGADQVEDPNEWLSVDIGDILEEEAAAKLQEGEHTLKSEAPTSTEIKVDESQRPFVYDSSPTASTHASIVPALQVDSPSTLTANLKETSLSTPPPKAPETHQAESCEEDLKISFMNFKAGSIALFVPVDASRKVWMAFHSNKPNRFLSPQSLDVFLKRRGKNSDKTRILARIVYIEQHVAGQLNAEPSHGYDGVKSPTVSTGDSGGSAAPAGSSVVKYEKHRNTYNLHPGTVYYECFAEPITSTVHSKHPDVCK